MSAGDYLILGLLAVLLVLSVRHWLRRRSCGGGCAGCPHAQGCRSQQRKTPGGLDETAKDRAGDEPM